MTVPLSTLLAVAVTVAVVHTVQGPDHYVPFLALRLSRRWSAARTAAVTLLCGAGHCASSVVLAFGAAWIAGSALDLQALQEKRGNLAGLLLLGFGLFLVLLGVRRQRHGHVHSHLHFHADGGPHVHSHDHRKAHAHAHEHRSVLFFWSLFLIFVLGPCEWLIPNSLIAYAEHGVRGFLLVCGTFSLATVSTMTAVTLLASEVLPLGKLAFLQRHATTMAGAAIALAALATLTLSV